MEAQGARLRPRAGAANPRRLTTTRGRPYGVGPATEGGTMTHLWTLAIAAALVAAWYIVALAVYRLTVKLIERLGQL